MKNLFLPISLHCNELLWKFVYFLFSVVLLAVIIFNQIDTLVFIETAPFLRLEKKFISVEITDLIELFWFITFSTTLLFTYPLFSFQINNFFKSSWYHYQFYFAKTTLSRILVMYTLTGLVYYLEFLPAILTFMTQWDNVFTRYRILIIEVQLSILSYITWTSELRHFLNFSLLLPLLYLNNLSLLKSLRYNYLLTKNYRKSILFLFLSLILLVLPPDMNFQLLLFVLSYIVVELFFLSLCLKLVNTWNN